MELGCDYLAVFSRFLLITPLHTALAWAGESQINNDFARLFAHSECTAFILFNIQLSTLAYIQTSQHFIPIRELSN